MKRLIFTTLAIIAMTGCDKNNVEAEFNDNKNANISFSTKAAVDNPFSTGDKIGITTTGYTHYGFDEFVNVGYVAESINNQLTFKCSDSDKAIIYPTVDKVAWDKLLIYKAYYPYTSASDGTSAYVEIVNQYDFICAQSTVSFDKTVSGYIYNYKEVDFTFAHKLVKLNIALNSDVITDGDISIELQGIQKEGKYSFVDDSFDYTGYATLGDVDINDNDKTNLSSYKATAYIFPMNYSESGKSFNMVITIDDYKHTISLDADCSSYMGKQVDVVITLDKKPTFTMNNIKGWEYGFETPGTIPTEKE